MIGALTVEGLLTMMTVDGATDTDVFMAFLEHCLCLKLQHGDVVVMDNLAAHKTKCVREAIEPAVQSSSFSRRTVPISTPSRSAGPR